jgi:hypothetical protein
MISSLGWLVYSEQQRRIASLDQHYRAERTLLRSDDGDLLDVGPHAWHAGLLAARPDLMAGTTFALGRPQADYLRERIVAEPRHILLASFAKDGARVENMNPPCEQPVRRSLALDLRRDLQDDELFSCQTGALAS